VELTVRRYYGFGAAAGGFARLPNNCYWMAGHVGDYSLPRLRGALSIRGFVDLRLRGDGLHHKRQIAPPWLVPVSLSSTLLAVAQKL